MRRWQWLRRSHQTKAPLALGHYYDYRRHLHHNVDYHKSHSKKEANTKIPASTSSSFGSLWNRRSITTNASDTDPNDLVSSTPLLAGLRLVELAGVLAGPTAGQFFAELGCEVIKVENPRVGGDVTRHWRLKDTDVVKDTIPSSYFQSCNLGKKALSIDLKSTSDRQVLLDLIASADIVTVSYKPGDARKLGVDFESLVQLNPRLIYAEITGYGPDDGRPGYDACLQAESGFTYMNGEPDSPPTKMPVALVDILAAHHLKEAILLALLERARTGKGKRLSVSLLRAAVISTANQAASWLLAKAIPERMGSAHPGICPYGTVFYDKNEKPFVLAVGTDAQFRALCEVLSLTPDDDYATNPQRVLHRHSVNLMLQERIGEFDRDKLLEALAQKAVPAGAVKNMAEVFGHAETRRCLVRGRYVSQIGWDEPGRASERDLLDPPRSIGQHDIEFKR